jgi:hypothetical protein
MDKDSVAELLPVVGMFQIVLISLGATSKIRTVLQVKSENHAE